MSSCGPRAQALRWLARRPLTVVETSRRLASEGFDGAEVERTVEALKSEGLLDDESLAFDFVVLRSARMQRGKRRLLLELERRGVDPGVAERAYQAAVDSGDLDPQTLLREAVAMRLKRERVLTDAGLRRVYNALLRAGFPAAELYAELKRQRDAFGPAEHENHDEGP
ncbi:MAG: hypothetical protein GTN89_01395 [Acidobacteria bacterium]|nr:hypothetical protein [Acidobacteriota bacterium]